MSPERRCAGGVHNGMLATAMSHWLVHQLMKAEGSCDRILCEAVGRCRHQAQLAQTACLIREATQELHGWPECF